MSRIIVIEGPDRVGKATQSKLLCEYLNSNGKKAVVVEVPVRGNFTYSVIYWMLKNGLAKMFPIAFQWMQCMNRLIFQSHDLVELEHDYEYIIFDRWSLSATVYGTASGVPVSFSDKMYKMLRKPDYTLVLLGASHLHEAEDVYESDADLQHRVRELYSDWAVAHSKESHVVDCTKQIAAVHDEIIRVLKASRIVPV